MGHGVNKEIRTANLLSGNMGCSVNIKMISVKYCLTLLLKFP